MIGRSTASLVLAALVGATSLLWAPTSGGAQSGDQLRIDWQSQDRGSGQALISGYVYNPHQMRVQRVQLKVQPSSGSGRARIVYLTGTIPSQGREYFEVRVPATEAPYTVSVAMFEWSGCGNG